MTGNPSSFIDSVYFSIYNEKNKKGGIIVIVNRCANCMEEITAYPCPHCGSTGSNHTNSNALPPLSILDGKYLVGRVLGQGGFGITYLGYDLEQNKKVAIKEYFPTGYVMRHPSVGSSLVWGTTPQCQEMHGNGISTFLREAKKLHLVHDLPGVVDVYRVFGENDTAYIIMEYLEGESLFHRIKHHGVLSWQEAQEIFLPAIETMAQCNDHGLIHRDISPDNLMLLPDGRVKVLDFGAAKDLSTSLGASSMVVGKTGFTPLEQYTQRGSAGPQADVYAMAATMYFAVTGDVPPSSLERSEHDTVNWDNPRFRKLPPHVQEAIQNAMAVFSSQRTRTMYDFLEGLQAPITPVIDPLRTYERYPEDIQEDAPKPAANPVGGRTALYAAIAAVAVLLAALVLFLRPAPKPESQASIPATTPSTAPAVTVPPETVPEATIPPETDPAPKATAPTAPDHTHSWNDADYNNPRICAICGVPLGSPKVPGDKLHLDSIVKTAEASSWAKSDNSGDHKADKIYDGRLDTNWTEGVYGTGIGEYVRFHLDGTYAIRSISIAIGSHYNQAVYNQNCRPSKIILTFSDGSKETIALEDTSEEQTIQLSRYYYTDSIILSIAEVYTGTTYQDTIIAEVDFTAYAP